MRSFRLLLATSLAVFVVPVYSDVIVTNVDENGNESVVKLSKDWGKVVDKSSPGQFMLIDMKKESFYVIDNQEKMVVQIGKGRQMPGMDPHGNVDKQAPNIEVKKIGAGQTIAGYETVQYTLLIDGQVCSDNFVSLELLKNPEIKAFADSMQKFAKSSMVPGFNDSPCEIAENYFDKKVFEYGVPLLSKNAQGQDVFKITEINTNISFSKDEFKLPDGYPVYTQDELLQREMSKAMSQSSGQPGNAGREKENTGEDTLSPEEIQKLQEQMQEQLQQMQEKMQQQ